MDKEGKFISGLNEGKIVQKKGKYFTINEKHKIIQEMLSNKITKQDIWEKYTGESEEHGQVLRWMRQLGYDSKIKTRIPNFATNQIFMSKEKNPKKSIGKENESFENLQLKKRVTELEIQLKDAEMKAIAFSTMIDIAEKEFNIPIRKKYNTKPLKK
jgi:hypothetical protein